MMGRFGRREFIKGILALGGTIILPGTSGCSPRGGKNRTLNFYNYSNYISPETIPDFESDYNSRVNVDYYSKQEILFAKIKIGVTGYDVIIATDNILRRFMRHGLLLPMKPEKIPNLSGLMEIFKSPPYDPGHKWSVPYLWGTTVIAYNRRYVKEPVNSWEILWNPKYKGKISMLDEKRDLIGCTLKMLGYPGNDTNHSHLERAKKKLIEQRPLVKKYTSDTYQDELVTNETWLCQGWSGDIIQAMRSNPDIDFVIPREGSFIWVDNCCIPTGAENPDLAREFINYLSTPRMGMKNAEFTGYPTPLKTSYNLMKKVNPAMACDSRIYPPEETMKNLEFYQDLGEEERYWNSLMEDVKLGKM